MVQRRFGDQKVVSTSPACVMLCEVFLENPPENSDAQFWSAGKFRYLLDVGVEAGKNRC